MSWIRRLRLSWQQLLGRPAPNRSAPPLALSHPVLGELAGTVEVLHGAVSAGTGTVTLTLTSDGAPVDEVLRLAVQVVEQLSALNERSLSRICEESRDSYNNDWRVGQTMSANGAAVDFERPQLSEAEFRAQFKLTGIEACGADLLTLWYDCGDLFWGHSFSATFFDGLAGEIDVQMFG